MIYKKGDWFLRKANKQFYTLAQVPGEVRDWPDAYVLHSGSRTHVIHKENLLYNFIHLDKSCPAVQILYSSMVQGGIK